MRHIPANPAITDDPTEWIKHPCKGDYGEDLWQNRHNLAAISVDGGKSYWLVDRHSDSIHIHQSQPSGKAPKS